MKHYRFRTTLDERCKLEKGTNLIIYSEEYTSKTCTRCGLLTDVGSSEVYKCSSCNLVIYRDINGARNIFIKCIDEMLYFHGATHGLRALSRVGFHTNLYESSSVNYIYILI